MTVPPKLKKPLKVLLAVIAFFTVSVLVDQLWCLRKLSGRAFEAQAEQITEINSACWTTYIGTAGGRAYLEFGTPGRWRPIVFWTKLSELPPDLSARLRKGDVPWAPWMERAKRERP
ncbi:hypothetical protein OJ996_02490 [Luteolibacter sp. GHJ8]|uniref:Uncharacterized protein n=1 Tax=Luteolibacter rhizosphaerae TaxID=2989719 RepID=A0ABT3FXY3_9BACT|nr:hypothetical protein [Luteolibacter rhizosphaerae]MCW1912423.1 hypothetical protein [Luteolibacter rhizosphaerae]